MDLIVKDWSEEEKNLEGGLGTLSIEAPPFRSIKYPDIIFTNTTQLR